MQTDDPPNSEIEDLDPGPPPRRGRLEARELLLGCLLLLVTIGWAGWQWWQQDSRERSYRQGLQAEEEYRWTEARADYTAALGYHDAESRIASVSGVINALQDNFVSARWHAQAGDWVAVLRAVQAVQRLDPYYGDATSLGAEASMHVYREALQGAIVVRPQAKPPGLYYRADDRWIWLEGSDEGSTVRSLLSSGIIVYDVPVARPSSHAAPPAALEVSPLGDAEQGSAPLAGRRLVAAVPVDGNTFRFTPLAFDPVSYDEYLAGDRGIWGVRKDSEPVLEQPRRGHPVLRGIPAFSTGRGLDYQALDSAVSTTVRLPGFEWAILGADLERNRLLLADVTEEREDSAVIDLYISDADGGNRRLIYSHKGALGSSQFSPDGRYVLLFTYNPLGGTRAEKLSLVLLDLQNGTPPLTVREKIVPATVPGSPSLPQMRAVFLREGSLAGMVLVAEWGDEHGALSVLDPARPSSPLMGAEIAGGPAGYAWINEQEEGAGPVVAWQPWLSNFTPGDGKLLLAQLAPGSQSVTRTITLGGGGEPVLSVIRGGNLICVAYRTEDSRDTGDLMLYSLPLSGPGTEQAMQLYSSTVSKGTSPAVAGFAWHFGSKLLSYSANGQLRARTYDGTIDVPLESGAASFFNFNWVSPMLLLR